MSLATREDQDHSETSSEVGLMLSCRSKSTSALIFLQLRVYIGSLGSVQEGQIAPKEETGLGEGQGGSLSLSLSLKK